VPLLEYFSRIDQVGVSHHFALVHEVLCAELEKVAGILRMKFEYITD
jgi:acyl-ACP thioesterase